MKYFFNEALKYGILELRDGLTLETLKEKFPRILRAKFKNVVLGIDNNELYFYNGICDNGEFKYEILESDYNDKDGIWFEGIWFNLTDILKVKLLKFKK